MVALIDTNVILDYLMVRKPQYDDALRLINACQERKVDMYMAFHSLSTIWYLLRKNPQLNRRKLLLKATDLFSVASASHEEAVSAIQNENFSDFEDCLQEKCALNVGADFIVTNNVKDFSASQIPAVTPAEILEVIFNGKNLYAESR